MLKGNKADAKMSRRSCHLAHVRAKSQVSHVLTSILNNVLNPGNRTLLHQYNLEDLKSETFTFECQQHLLYPPWRRLVLNLVPINAEEMRGKLMRSVFNRDNDDSS